MARRPFNDAQRNARLAFLAQRFGKGQTNANLIIALMQAFPDCSEQTARKDLQALYERYYDIHKDNIDLAFIRAVEQAAEAYQTCIDMCQMSAAVRALEHLHSLMGLDPKKANKEKEQENTNTIITSDFVRARIKKLLESKKVQEKAKELEIDLTTLARTDGESN